MPSAVMKHVHRDAIVAGCSILLTHRMWNFAVRLMTSKVKVIARSQKSYCVMRYLCNLWADFD